MATRVNCLPITHIRVNYFTEANELPTRKTSIYEGLHNMDIIKKRIYIFDNLNLTWSAAETEALKIGNISVKICFSGSLP